MTDPTEVFWRAHHGLPREAPGSEATTRLLLHLAGALPGEPAVLDVGCGTGPATVLLAQLTGGHVTAVDLHEPFLDAVAARARAAGVSDRVRTLAASMDEIPLPHGSVDLLWAEGSAHVIGFDAALSAWRPLLAPTGVLVLTEAEWLTPDPAPAARAFWRAGYPAMRTTAGNVDAAQRAGWTVHATHVLPESDWDEYYGPLSARLDQLRREGVPEDLLARVGEEIAVRAAHGGDYAYTGYVLRPRAHGGGRAAG
ncbi:class I SAM-dependent methyltransferase [Paenibacillus sp. TRM 82003]|uniref:class I SAM-dependent methyltransferase n=1 Tax=Kineococcus sp. TRM81007 TaxID=2925831 RepID=UPI001F598369|nr:class I SAM-dependent methyltransferase [Kineococcus sp. TRM81007]MCI2237563.1 class I SAM-dependent methyltransferase [Kineococcus sp. TRM81007]MCI3921865.1 class I SAM-dependent methyltransferase [Paenibacillus sp. TRM 82003]